MVTIYLENSNNTSAVVSEVVIKGKHFYYSIPELNCIPAELDTKDVNKRNTTDEDIEYLSQVGLYESFKKMLRLNIGVNIHNVFDNITYSMNNSYVPGILLSEIISIFYVIKQIHDDVFGVEDKEVSDYFDKAMKVIDSSIEKDGSDNQLKHRITEMMNYENSRFVNQVVNMSMYLRCGDKSLFENLSKKFF